MSGAADPSDPQKRVYRRVYAAPLRKRATGESQARENVTVRVLLAGTRTLHATAQPTVSPGSEGVVTATKRQRHTNTYTV